MKTSVVILAAGSSSRLGRPKQLIEIQGKTLVQKAVDEVYRSRADSMVVVLGWNPVLIQTGFDSAKVPSVINPNWESGMASSIQAGLHFLLENGEIDQVMIMLCDQPFVDSEYLDQLFEEGLKSEKGIVASFYSNTRGVPALFSKKYFPELLALKGQDGAKKVLLEHRGDVLKIDFPNGAIDLDTEADLRRLMDQLGE
ncbi:nucleotidyltransferase family protein [Algoriphagus aestuariicola]|uniref:Nucleotidyltransferase family protein n=1 Tax=Algoriphagus aestuariicola TaxID=1852016 RepID=A0ABS3BQW5_9BACT|nr:nucleotidyltransferase family protein [Algoriphagus aestuariicola]MBN7800730.1 nucleotidyltransferase family protein [Algoriphagus aestuariicola]